ncbi:MAG: transglycosylase SLT domain-containing protein [Calditrichia bacterium]|nr:transglycosylase SLT domain-containing protein [Calditrichia bacterium]
MKIFLVFIQIIFFVSCSDNEIQNGDIVDNDSLSVELKRKIEEKKQLDEFRLVFERRGYLKSIAKYKPIIKKYSKRYGFDWRLIVAQIMQESRFREKARSHVGAKGLMQIMPRTATELSKELDIQYILKNPRENIAAGIYHMKKQYGHFPNADFQNRTKLSLAAYNCGVGRIYDAQALTKFNRISPNVWSNVNQNLGKLKPKYWEIHLQVWPQGRPKYGYFYGEVETITYVENIWTLYTLYKKIL